MDKIKIVILSIIAALVFGSSMESHAQFSFVNDSCHASLMSSNFNKWSFSLSSPTFVQHDGNKQGLTTFEKILNVPLGMLFGSFAGYLIGTSLPSDRSVENLANRIKGGLIGAFAGPYVNYEIMSVMKGVKNPLNYWSLNAGANMILPNYDDTTYRTGYSFGISRYYPLSSSFTLQGELGFQTRQFKLASRRILYSTFGFRQIRNCDINFSVGYIDMSLLLNVKALTFRRSTLSIALGPSLAIEVFDNTDFHLIKIEDDQDDFDFVYIDDEPDPLFGYPAMLYKLELQHGHWIWQFGFHHSLIYTDEIYPLVSNTRLRTFELNIGYKL